MASRLHRPERPEPLVASRATPLVRPRQVGEESRAPERVTKPYTSGSFAVFTRVIPCKWFLLRRLFSTFATGLPGAGLLLMRLVCGSILVFRGAAGLAGALAPGPVPLLASKIVLGLLLIAGL